MRVLVLIAAALMSASSAGQTTGASSGASNSPSAAAAAKPGSSALTPSSLRTDGLNFGDDLTRLYVGEFGRMGFARDGTEMSMLVSVYMHTFSTACASELPKNKVEIMTQECTRETWTVNGYGVEQPGSRRCTDYRTVGTGRYADPEVYRLHSQLDAATARAVMGGVFGAMRPGGDPVGGVRRMTDVAVYAKSDIPKLVQASGCASPALKRLQANLVRFGQGTDPIVMPGGAAALAPQGSAAGGPSKDQNYQRLIDDLITEQSQAWMMNRYQPGSARAAAPTLDAQGRPREVGAGYTFGAMGKTYTGRVRVTFVDGVPQCLYFSDLPESCRVPSPRIVSAFRKNQYAGGLSPEPASRAVTTAPPVSRAAEVSRPTEAAAPAEAAAPVPPRPASPADRTDTVAPRASTEPGAGASPPEAERAMPGRGSAPETRQQAEAAREAAQEARAAALQDRQAASRERRCEFLRANIERARESAANASPQRAQRAEAQIERAERSYAQQCDR